jgi:hypothetical protein
VEGLPVSSYVLRLQRSSVKGDNVKREDRTMLTLDISRRFERLRLTRLQLRASFGHFEVKTRLKGRAFQISPVISETERVLWRDRRVRQIRPVYFCVFGQYQMTSAFAQNKLCTLQKRHSRNNVASSSSRAGALCRKWDVALRMF